MKRTFKALLIVAVILAVFSGSAAAFQVQPVNVTLFDRGVFYTYGSMSKTAGSLFDEKNITVGSSDIVSVLTKDEYGNVVELPFSPDVMLEEGMGFKIDRAVKVNIFADNQMLSVDTFYPTVGELLASMPQFSGSEFRVADFLPSDRIYEDMVIKLGRISTKSTFSQFEIPFKTEMVENPDMLVGQETIIQEGIDGIIQTEHEETYLDNDKISTVVTNSLVLSEPVNRIVQIGTKKPANMVAGNVYSKVLNVTATAYTANESARTYTGIKPYEGVISVDPSVIPLGTKVYVEGYGEAIAADTGKSIKGNKIDLFYDTYREAINYGVKSIKVYILD